MVCTKRRQAVCFLFKWCKMFLKGMVYNEKYREDKKTVVAFSGGNNVALQCTGCGVSGYDYKSECH